MGDISKGRSCFHTPSRPGRQKGVLDRPDDLLLHWLGISTRHVDISVHQNFGDDSDVDAAGDEGPRKG